MLKALSWFGTATGIAGSFVVAFHFFTIGYGLFLVSSAAWSYVGIVKQDKPTLTMQGVFFVANVIGLYNAVF